MKLRRCGRIVVITPDGKGEGTLIPACRLRLDKKKNELQIESYQNPWKLDHFIVHFGD